MTNPMNEFTQTAINQLAIALDDRDDSCRSLLATRLPIIFEMLDGNMIIDPFIEASAYDLALELITLCFLITTPDFIHQWIMDLIYRASLIIS
jgi:hypothetical protein